MALKLTLLAECEWCGGPMPTTGRFRRFCSRECYSIMYRTIHKEELKEQVTKRQESQPVDHAKHYQRAIERLGEDVFRSTMRTKQLKRQFGLTPDSYDQLLIAQNGVCAICGKTPEENGKRLSIDHDHSCCPKRENTCGNCIRGLLCTACNARLGVVESTEWVQSANSYLNKY